MSAVVIDFGFQGPAARAGAVRAIAPRAVVPRAAATASRRSHLRMTARGRAVLLTLITAPLVVAALALGINAGSANGTTSSTRLTTVTVVGGETLWGLAHQIAPHADPRDVVDDIVAVNELPSADIQPGEKLSIPAKYAH